MTGDFLDAMRRELIRDEGLRLRAYKDTAGKVTVGVGRNISDLGLSEEEAAYLLTNDILRVRAELQRTVPTWGELDEVRQRVLINVCFNVGLSRFLQFRRMLAAVQAGDFGTAANELLISAWSVQVGQRARRLAAMMASGTDA